MQAKSCLTENEKKNKNLRMQKNMKFISSILLPLFIVFFKPLGMNLNQSIILGTLVLVLT